MASVFDPFRKKQKQWLAVLGVLCMGGFIFGGMDCDSGPGGAARADDYAVTINGEGMTNREVESLLQDHLMASQFTSRLKGFDSDVFLPVSREFAVYTHMLAKRGEELGVAVSDEAINRFIDDNNYTRMTQSKIKELASNYRWPMESLFRALRMELMAKQTLDMYVPTSDSAVASPARMWEYYQRLHRRANTEILQIDVKNYVSQVEEPTEDDLQKLFTEFKSRLPDPNSPDPGFTQPTRATIDYVEADYQKFLRQAESEITEAELQTYYDEHKDAEFKFTRFVPEGPPLVAPPAANDPPPGQPKDDAAEGATTAGDKAGDQADAAAGGDAAQGDAAGSGGGDAGAGNSGGGDTGNGGGQEPWPVSAPFDPAQDGGQTGDSQTGGQNGQSTDDNKTGQDATGQNATGQDAGTQNAGDASQQGGDATQPGETSPDGVQQDNRSIQTIAEQFRIPKRLIDGPNPTHDPFWKVRSKILNKLAVEKVTERINAGVDKIRTLLDSRAAEVSRYQARRMGEDPNSDTAKADLRKKISEICEEHGLVYHPQAAQQLDVVAFSELEDLKKVSVFAGGNFRSLAGAIFTPSIGLYTVVEGDDIDSNKFVAWKTEEQKQFEPKTLEEVRTQVVDAWKLRKARELAKARAEEIVNGVNDGGKALDSFVTEQMPLVKVDPFSWYTENYDPSVISPQIAAQIGYNFAPYSQTPIEKLPRVGYDFMEATFKLAEGTSAVAANLPQTSYYVVKLKTYDYVTALGGTAEVDAHRAFLLTNPEKFRYLYAYDYQGLKEEFIRQMAINSNVLWADPPAQQQ